MPDNSQKITKLRAEIAVANKKLNDIIFKHERLIKPLKDKKQKLQMQLDKLVVAQAGKPDLNQPTNEEVGAPAPVITTGSVGDAAEFGGKANYAPKIGDTIKRTTKKKKKKKKKKNESVNPVDRYIDNL